jgi:hypothetical protein
VVYNGKPVTGGIITFLPADSRQNSVTAELDAQGHFEATLPVGEVKIAVDNRELEPRPNTPRPPPTMPKDMKLPPGAEKGAKEPAGGAAPSKSNLPGTYVPIPRQYYDITTSGLTYTVQPGSQSKDIELK